MDTASFFRYPFRLFICTTSNSSWDMGLARHLTKSNIASKRVLDV